MTRWRHVCFQIFANCGQRQLNGFCQHRFLCCQRSYQDNAASKERQMPDVLQWYGMLWANECNYLIVVANANILKSDQARKRYVFNGSALRLDR